MIIIKVRNGIGNQLFTYAFGEFLKKKCLDQIIKYDTSELPLFVNGRYTVSFTDFIVDAEQLTPYEVRHYLGKVLYFKRLRSNEKTIVDSLERKIVNHIRIPKKYELIAEPTESEENKTAFVKEIFSMKLKNNKHYVFDGFWEDIRYVEQVKDVLKANLSFCGVNIGDNYKDIIKGKNLVSVHIRRGDYIKESFATNYPRYYYAYCDESYYREAITKIENQVNDPFFVFFSDDPDYVKKKYKSMNNKIVVEGQKDYEDLYFMTLCKHHIIANSTFSFWGAYVAREEGITIAPSVHYSYLISESDRWSKQFFYVPEWQYIEVDDKI